MLKYVFAAIFIALAWAAAIVFHGVAPLLWAAIAVTVCLVLGLGLWAIMSAIFTRKAAGAIEAGLDNAARARPDQQAEIGAMQLEFQRAIAGLKSSRLGHKGRDALSLLPWYVIIGPPGAGKTTALRSSGLQFPYAKGGKVKGVGGTRNCDWWLTNEAIILDTAGRWSTQDDDHDEWLAFLRLLRKTRPKKPVNGILLAVSLLNLDGGEVEVAALAKALRERLDEVTGCLDMVVPVYLLVTKTDLVPGFVEMWGNLRDKERGQIWGVTLRSWPVPTSTGLLEEQLQELFDVAGQRAFFRMCDERRLEARHKIFEFAPQLEALGRNLSLLVADLFADNVYQDAPILRGVYFTSGTQEGAAHRPHHAEYGQCLRCRRARRRGFGGRDQAQELLLARRLYRGGVPRPGGGRAQQSGHAPTAALALGVDGGRLRAGGRPAPPADSLLPDQLGLCQRCPARHQQAFRQPGGQGRHGAAFG